MEIEIINLTPHAITIYRSKDDDHPIVIEPSGQVARVSSTTTPELSDLSRRLWADYGIPVARTALGDVTGLPEYQPRFAYVVSGMVLDAVGETQPDRHDLLAPGELLRDADGRPVGCIGLRR